MVSTGVGWLPRRSSNSVNRPAVVGSLRELPMSSSWPRNRLTERLAIDYPIVQGPLGGLSSQRLTAAVSNFGGLGSFGAHGLTPDAIRSVVREIRSLTNHPFAMNLWVSMEDEGAATSGEAEFERSLSFIRKYIEEVNGLPPEYTPY